MTCPKRVREQIVKKGPFLGVKITPPYASMHKLTHEERLIEFSKAVSFSC